MEITYTFVYTNILDWVDNVSLPAGLVHHNLRDCNLTFAFHHL